MGLPNGEVQVNPGSKHEYVYVMSGQSVSNRLQKHATEVLMARYCLI